jgi:Cu-Zn family superoxide dismutase
MKAIIVTLAATIIGAGAAYAASETVTMNAIDATGVGKKTRCPLLAQSGHLRQYS